MAAEHSEHTHIPVLADTVARMLAVEPTGTYCDMTLGGGGHFMKLAQMLENKARIIGVDRDAQALAAARQRCTQISPGPECLFVHAGFADVEKMLRSHAIEQVDGILMDLGMSSIQLNDSARGFSFKKDCPLDMRMDQTESSTASDILAEYSTPQLTHVLQHYGEIRNAARMAATIKEWIAAESIETSSQLVRCLRNEYGRNLKSKVIAKVFQALRIAVNDELQQLEQALETMPRVIKKGGRLAVISYHSLEDRMVKNYMREKERVCVCPPESPVCSCNHSPSFSRVNRKAIKPSQEEIERNPRARSARLRVAQRV